MTRVRASASTSATIGRIGGMRCGVGESPVWHDADAALHWIDITGRA
ncbi:hypothetical protein JMY07_16965 [Burkholderia thailandensis]|nr:hypothetical protein [Burkholderia thailandensis]QRA10965.1 hypothetical protein JMY07_16965 [Burkholderia thailandensis]